MTSIALLHPLLLIHSTGRFTAQLTTEPTSRQSTLSIVESNSFRNIVHVSLAMVPANDAMLKQFLADSLRDYKRQVSSLESDLVAARSRLSSSLEESGSTAARLARDLERERAAHEQEIRELRVSHAEQMERERDDRGRERENQRRERERDRAETEGRYESQVIGRKPTQLARRLILPVFIQRYGQCRQKWLP